MVRKHFPHAKLIINIRDPKEAFPSFVAMISALRGQPLSELDGRLKLYYKTVSRAMYEGSAKYSGDPNTYYHNFKDWKDDGPKSLARIWQWLGWTFESGDLQIALRKHESHRNPPACFDFISSEEIDADLGELYQTCLAQC